MAQTNTADAAAADENMGWSSPIHEAVWTNNKEKVRQLVSDSSINLEAVVEDCTPLYLACLKGHTEVAKILIEGRAKVDGDSPPIFAAAGKGNVSLVKLLLDSGADPSAFSTQHAGCCALHIAAEKNYVEVVKLLLEQANVNVNVRSVKQQLTPLISASCCGSLDAVKVLLDSGADIDAQSSTGNTALMLAIDRGKIDVALALIRNRADLEIRGQKGWTALHNAASGGEKGYKEVAEALLAAGASVDALSETMLTPLHEAAGKSLVEIVQLLVDRGANVNARDKFNNTPLRMCASNAQSFATIDTFKGTVEILLRAGADVNAGTTINTTSLHSVVKWGNVEAVKFMLDKGADANIRTSKGELPIDFSKNPEVKAILKPVTKMPKPEKPASPWNSENWMPDHMATKCGYCHKQFSFVVRKHHCRNCGQIFCGDCTSSRAKVPGAKEPLARVCLTCAQDLQQNQQSKQNST